MTDIGRMRHDAVAANSSHVSWGVKFDAFLDSFVATMTSWLCRASRGYLCPPDMTEIMYPDESRQSNSRAKECCNEKLPGK